jgi:hypothetical protein
MRISLIKITLLLLLAGLFCGASLLTQAQTKGSPEKSTDRDTTEYKKGKFPFEASEISISEDKIYVRTKEGKEYLVGPEGRIRIPTEDGEKYYILRGEEPVDEIILDEGRMKIGDLEIDLKDLEELEALGDLEELKKMPRIRIPKVPVTPRVYTSEGIFRMGRDIVVDEDEVVDGDVVALGGSIQVRGSVNGSAVAIGGDVEVFSTGAVEEDAVSIGGQVTKRGGAVVRGEKVSVGFLRSPRIRLPFGPAHFPMFHPFGFTAWAFIGRVFKILFFIFLGIVVLAILPKNVNKIKEKVKHDLVKSGLVGLAAQVLVIPIFILLMITIIGIPVALLVQPLLIIAALILGYTGTCLFVGEKLQEHTSLKPETKIMVLVVGILAVELVPLVARTIGIFGGPFSPLALIFSIIGWLIAYVVITVGFGAAILSRLGTRPKDVSAAAASANATSSDSKQ